MFQMWKKFLTVRVAKHCNGYKENLLGLPWILQAQEWII